MKGRGGTVGLGFVVVAEGEEEGESVSLLQAA